MKTSPAFLLLIPLCGLVMTTAHGAEKLKALIIDGQNNHNWQATTPVLKWSLEKSGKFTVDISTSPGRAPRAPQPPKNQSPQETAAYEAAKAKWQKDKEALESQNQTLWKAWTPKFSEYAVVISNYNGDLWPEHVQKDFVDFVRRGGGFVSVHAADNAFPEWLEYNQMIGLGGWGGRNEKSGPMIRFKDGKFIADESPGSGGTHGVQHEFVVEIRDPEHPIVKGLPVKWKHASDELYAKLRGPAKNMQVLATAFSAPDTRGTGEHEPMLMVTQFGKGRVFHTTLGHSATAMSGLGFQVTLARGAEWVATGKVTAPDLGAWDLPEDKAAIRDPSGN